MVFYWNLTTFKPAWCLGLSRKAKESDGCTSIPRQAFERLLKQRPRANLSACARHQHLTTAQDRHCAAFPQLCCARDGGRSHRNRESRVTSDYTLEHAKCLSFAFCHVDPHLLASVLWETRYAIECTTERPILAAEDRGPNVAAP